MVRIGIAACALALLPMAAPAQETAWDVSLWGKRRAFTEHVERLATLVERRTRGAFRITLHYGGLAPSRENLDGIAAGAFEMAQFCAGYHREKNRTLTVLELPSLGVATLAEERAISRAIYDHPATRAELAQWNAVPLMPSPLPQYNLVGRGTPPEGTVWFEGKRIRATGGIGRSLAAQGATAESLTATETRGAFESGAIDAVAFAPHAHFSFDTISLAEWWTTNLNPGSVNCPVVVNADALAALPEAHRAALLESVGPALDYYLLNYADIEAKFAEVLAVFGIGRVAFPEADLAAMREEARAEIHSAWLAEMAEAGLPGDDLLATLRDALSAHREAVEN